MENQEFRVKPGEPFKCCECDITAEKAGYLLYLDKYYCKKHITDELRTKFKQEKKVNQEEQKAHVQGDEVEGEEEAPETTRTSVRRKK